MFRTAVSPLPTTPRRCAFYSLDPKSCLFQTITTKTSEHESSVKKRDAVTIKPGVTIHCSCCGCRMNKDGFTTYEKQIVNLRLGTSRSFALQRLQCSNKACPGKTKHGNNETHVLLPSDCVPKSELAAENLEDAQKTLSILEKSLGKSLSNKPKSKLHSKLESLMHTDPFLVRIKHRYHDFCSNLFINQYVLSKSGIRLCKSIELLKSMVSVFWQCNKEQNSTLLSSGAANLPNILVTICSESVKNLSTLHKISLPFITDKIHLCSSEEPP